MGLAGNLLGCKPSTPLFLRDDGDLSHYKGVATQIEYPDVTSDRIDDVAKAQAPLTVANTEPREIWDLTLQEAIQTAVSNSKVMRSLGVQAFVPTTFAGSTANQTDPSRLVSTPTGVTTTYTPSIIESDPRVGVEGALSAFDAQLSSSLFWYKTDQPQNLGGAFLTAFANPILRQDLGQEQVQLSKKLATGGQVYLRDFNNYTYSNQANVQFPSVFVPYIEAEFSHPLLQGAGVQFNRIAGPNSFAGLNSATSGPNVVPGNYNGVMIARINHDIALADLEVGVRNLVNEVESAYWRLYFTYRAMDAQMVGRDSALQTWRKIHALFQESARGGEAEKEAQARAQYFLFRSQVEGALSDLYTAENRLRYMMGIATTDGRLIRPADEPTTARVQFDWNTALSESLARTVELRQERWRIKQQELSLIAAKNFMLPQLNFDALYRWRGFGNNLLGGQNSPVGPSGSPVGVTGLQNAYQTLLSNNYQEYQIGFNFNMPIGFRQGMAAVRNAQLQLARERAILQDQEFEVSHQLANGIRALDRFYALSQTNFNRRVATQKQVDAVRAAYETQTVTLDLLLEAQRQLADAESTYYDALSLYNLAICQVHLRKGSLLEYNNVYMAEGPWVDKAYFDARKRARERDAGVFIDYGFTRPSVMTRGPVNQQSGAYNGATYRSDADTPPPADGSPETVPVPPGEQSGPKPMQQASGNAFRRLPPTESDNGAAPTFTWNPLASNPALPAGASPAMVDAPHSNLQLTGGQSDASLPSGSAGRVDRIPASESGSER
jgi:outer membrane protein TolC